MILSLLPVILIYQERLYLNSLNSVSIATNNQIINQRKTEQMKYPFSFQCAKVLKVFSKKKKFWLIRFFFLQRGWNFRTKLFLLHPIRVR